MTAGATMKAGLAAHAVELKFAAARL